MQYIHIQKKHIILTHEKSFINYSLFINRLYHFSMKHGEIFFYQCEHPAQNFIRRAQEKKCFGESWLSLKSQIFLSLLIHFMSARMFGCHNRFR